MTSGSSFEEGPLRLTLMKTADDPSQSQWSEVRLFALKWGKSINALALLGVLLSCGENGPQVHPEKSPGKGGLEKLVGAGGSYTMVTVFVEQWAASSGGENREDVKFGWQSDGSYSFKLEEANAHLPAEVANSTPGFLRWDTPPREEEFGQGEVGQWAAKNPFPQKGGPKTQLSEDIHFPRPGTRRFRVVKQPFVWSGIMLVGRQ